MPDENVFVPTGAAGTTLDGALLRAQEKLTHIVKDAHNAYANYDYVSSEAMLEACRKALHLSGLVITPSGESPKLELQEGPGLVVTRGWNLAHPASGQNRVYHWTYPVVPGKGKPMDKAMSTALTTGLSYFLRDLMQVPRPEHEVDNRDDSTVSEPIQTATRGPGEPPAALLERIDMLRHASASVSSMGSWTDQEVWNWLVKRAAEEGAELGPKWVDLLIAKAWEAAKAKDLRDVSDALDAKKS